MLCHGGLSASLVQIQSDGKKHKLDLIGSVRGKDIVLVSDTMSARYHLEQVVDFLKKEGGKFDVPAFEAGNLCCSSCRDSFKL